MKNKLLPVLITFIIIIAVASCVVLSIRKNAGTDTIRLYRLKAEIENNKNDFSKVDNLGFNIIVIDMNGEVKYPNTETGIKSYEEWLNYAYQNDCVIIDYSEGKILVLPDNTVIDAVILVISIFSAAIVALLCWYNFYIQKVMFKPFKKLKGFAGDIAAGNLDRPLSMDKHNAFGAFSESFDIMRTELKKSKEKEIELEKSKKRLVAELSHDIKTPIASIKAVSDLLKLNETDDKKLNNIGVIKNKANEIDNLVTDLFSSALQDLSELKININVISSKDISLIIKEADFLNKINGIKIPDCLIKADSLRLMQIAGNIINNSYKYAGTEIKIASELFDDTLSIEFLDFGKGVLDEELPLITNQFYRGKNNTKTTGAGLGLYICKLMLEKMGGGIDCYNIENGFAVKIFLKLA